MILASQQEYELYCTWIGIGKMLAFHLWACGCLLIETWALLYVRLDQAPIS